MTGEKDPQERKMDGTKKRDDGKKELPGKEASGMDRVISRKERKADREKEWLR
jgi:hypothetical protein